MLAFLRETIGPPILLVVYLKNGTMFYNLLALNTMWCRGSTAINRLTRSFKYSDIYLVHH
jgi:hypothetical protein